ncbi:MAG: GNAT family N-acetyltransferase [Magnetococcales bacterium]|nr:GNAT family N-acetyltransferase [Magnetococcales bacterium]
MPNNPSVSVPNPAPLLSGEEELASLGLTFRPEAAADEAFLQQLYFSVRWPELEAASHWSDEEKIAFLQFQFRAQRQHYATAYACASFLVALADGIEAGRLCLYRSARELRVVDIAFLPEFRHRGYATALFRQLFAEADIDARKVSIHVEIFNPARRLYDRLGFVVTGETGPYYLMERFPASTSSQEEPHVPAHV